MSDSTHDTGGPAFPLIEYIGGKKVLGPGGMTLRDYFAVHASEEDIKNHKGDGYMEEYAADLGSGRKEIRSRRVFRSREEAKYRYADAMLEARKS